ncbi:MAG: RpiB/LacA/LacB family sugar-phosphate isomerase [bacterium]
MHKVYIAADHAGFALKAALASYIGTIGYEVEDLGAHSLEPDDDYPDYVTPCARRVADEPGSFGIVIGGSGQGEAMAANRVPGIRAAVFYGPQNAVHATDARETAGIDGFDIVRLEREHNDANILSLGARFLSGSEAAEAAHLFLTTSFSGDERHKRRLLKF